MKGIVMLDVSMGKDRVRVWPKKRGKAKTAEAKKLQDSFRQASWACKYWDPRNIVSIDEMRKGTPVLIRDLQIMMMYNRFANFALSDGRRLWSVQARQDVSDSLDSICPLPGAILIRTPEGWRYVVPAPTPGLVLTSAGVDGKAADWEAPYIPPGTGALWLIEEKKLVATATSVTFASIPNTYQDLTFTSLQRSAATTGETPMWVRFNGNSSNLYSSTRWNQFGPTYYDLTAQGVMGEICGSNRTAKHFNGSETTIFGYARNDVVKRWQGRCDADPAAAAGHAVTELTGGQWEKADAITSITLFPDVGSFAIGSEFRLYGRA